MIRKLKNRLAEWPHDQAQFHFSVLVECGHCPGGCRDGIGGLMASRVYRSSRRSLTMQCTLCGLQWTMTVHRIAQVIARKAAAPNADWLVQNIAELWVEWAARVDDQRGRRKSLTGGQDDVPAQKTPERQPLPPPETDPR